VHLTYLHEAARSLRHHRGLATTAIFSLTSALLLCGVFLLLTHNAEVTLRLIGDRREMVVYLRDDVNEPQRETLMARFRDLYGEVTYVSKAQAWEELKQQVGDPSLLDAVDDNPLPASLRVRLKPALLEPDAMDQTARQVAAFPEVEDVRYGAEWVRRLDGLKTGLLWGSLAAGITVALAIVFVIYNTLRLTVLARRPQVEIMSRLGASDRFIALPFLIEAVFEAGLAAAIALGILFALHLGLSTRVIGIVFLPPLWCLAFLGAAVLLAWIAASWAVSRVLRAVGP
jgi:cell division transport system permease protein